MAERTRYLVAGMSRSGTSVTYLCVAGHPRAHGLTDEVRPDAFFGDGLSKFTFGNESQFERERAHLALFDAMTTIGAEPSAIACGMKTAFNSVKEVETLVSCLQARLRDVRVILTIRDDWVAQLGSIMRATRTGKWHSWVRVGGVQAEAFHIEPSLFVDYAKMCRDVIATLRKLHDSHEVIELGYEADILTNAPDCYQKLFDFLGLPRVEIDWLRSTKVAPPPGDFILNYDELTGIQEQIRSGRPVASEPGVSWRDFMKEWRSDAEVTARASNHLQRAWQAIASGDYDAAIAETAQVPEESPRFCTALIVKAQAHRLKGDYDLARTAIDESLAITDELAEAFVEQAWLALHQEQLDDGIRAAEHVLSLNAPAQVEAGAWHALGALRRARDELEEAITCLGHAVELNPKLRNVRVIRGWLLRDAGRLDEAMAAANEVLAEDPGHAEALRLKVMLAQSHRLHRNYDRAAEILDESVALDRRGVVHVELAWLELERGRFEAGVQAAERALAMDPPPELQAAANDSLGLLWRSLNDFGKSIDSIDRAVALSPDNSKLHVHRGWLLRDAGRPEDAAAAADTALALNPNDEEAIQLKSELLGTRSD